jgi:hypothetical protein
VRNRNLVVALAALICVLFLAAHVAARKTVDVDGREHALSVSKAVPSTLSYQGFLVDATDSSTITATLEMTFRLYDSEIKGAELWSETHPAVEISNGLFQVLLGSDTPFPAGLFDGTALWLQTEVGTEALSPRKPLVSVAYSHRASSAEMLLDNTLTDLDDRWVNEGDLDHLDAADSDPAEAVYVDDAGKVGIGTISPLTELDVNGSVNATTYYGDGSNLTGIIGTTDNDWAIAGDDVYHETGNVGIGTAAPVYPLHVDGIASAKGLWLPGAFGPDTNYVGQDGNWIAFGHPGTSEDFLGYKGNAFYFMDSPAGADTTDADVIIGGNVGIGTTSPSAKVEVKDSTGLRLTSATVDNCYGDFLPDYGTGRGGLTINSWTGGTWADISFQTNGTTRMFLDSGGNVGIGTESPGAGLHVKGAGWPRSFIYVDSDQDQDAGFRILEADTARWHIFNSSGENDALRIYNFDGSHTVFFAEQEHGRVGIGTTNPVYQLDVTSSNYPAVRGYNSNSGNIGTLGGTATGVYGWSSDSYGVNGLSTTSRGVYGQSEYDVGVYGASTTNYAGYFFGPLHVTGALSKGSGTFLIDHPLDPENKLLRHSFVESPENLLIYRGKVRLDAGGQALVEMPDYFRALTKESEATIHLTSVGRPFLTGYEWRSDGVSFLAYGEPSREVSWMVMADRDDPVIRQLARPVEEDKGPDNKLCDRGELLYPTAYGYPESMGKDYRERMKLENLDK